MVFRIPSAPTEPVIRLERTSILLYGPPKVGKSTLCAQAPNALFLCTEPGVDHLRVRRAPVTDYQDLIDAIDQLEASFAKGPPPCETLVIDTLDNLFSFIDYHVAQKENKEFVSYTDIGFGRGKGRVKNLFRNAMLRLMALPCGLWMTSHTALSKPDANGKSRTVSSLPDEVRSIVNGAVDMILYLDDYAFKGDDGKIQERRAIYTRKTNGIEAGCRSANMPEIVALNYEALKMAYEGKKE